MAAESDITSLLERASSGDSRAADSLLPLVYGELRAHAERLMQQERIDHTLQATALVHEAYLRLVDQTRVEFNSRGHFFAIAARAIRQILVDHARTRGRAKRGGGAAPVPLDEGLVSAYEKSTDLLALDEALEKLAATHPRPAKIVEMRFFAGLTIDETAVVLGTSTATVEREWRFARAWLFRALGDSHAAMLPKVDDDD